MAAGEGGLGGETAELSAGAEGASGEVSGHGCGLYSENGREKAWKDEICNVR